MEITWETDPGPKDLSGYRLERKASGGGYVTLTPRTTETRYHDHDGVASDVYRLFAINRLGDELFLGETSGVPVQPVPGGLAVFPTPYRSGQLTIEFATTEIGGQSLKTEVAIYDLSGRRVRTLVEGRFDTPVHRVTWDGRDDNGSDVASGVYFIRIQTEISSRTRKLVIAR